MDANTNSKTLRCFPIKRKIFLLSSLLPGAGGAAEIRMWEGGGETPASPTQRLDSNNTASCTDPTTRTRPQAHRGCSYQVPPAGEDPRRPESGYGSERPPGWGAPVRFRLPLTSLGGEDRAFPWAAGAARLPQDPSGRGGGANSRESRSRAQPVSAQGGRYYSPAPLSWASSFLLPAVPTTLTSGSREASHRSRLHPRPGHPVSAEPQATLGLRLPAGRRSGSVFTACWGRVWARRGREWGPGARPWLRVRRSTRAARILARAAGPTREGYVGPWFPTKPAGTHGDSRDGP